MPQRQFPLDPVQTQITKPTTTVTARPVAPPQQTGLSQGLAIFGKAVGSAARLAKARQFDEELKIAELDAARGRVSPGLVSQKAIDLNRNTLDANFASDLTMQVKAWEDTAGTNIANDVTLTKTEKATLINNVLNTYREKLKYITHSGEALAKADLFLKTTKHGLYTAIGQHDLQVVFQEETKHAKHTLEAIALHPEGKYDKDLAQIFIKRFADLEAEHPYRIVDGKKIRVAADWDERKAVFSLMSGSVREHLGNRPELFYQFEEVIREFFKPLADQENTLNVQGKGDVIGDNTTLQSLIDSYYGGVDADQKKTARDNKDGDEIWVSQTLFGLLANESRLREVPPDQYEEGGDIYNHYGGNIYSINKAVGEMNKYLKNDKWGIYTVPFFEGLKKVLTGEIIDEQQIETFGINNSLSPDAIAALKTDLTEKRQDIQDNINVLKDRTPIFTGSHLMRALKTGIRSEYISKKLEKFGIDLESAIDFTALQSIVSGANNLKNVKQIIGPLKKIQDYLLETEELRTKLARTAAYRQDNLGRDVTDITKNDIDSFVKERFKTFEEILKEYTLALEVIPLPTP